MQASQIFLPMLATNSIFEASESRLDPRKRFVTTAEIEGAV